MQSWKFQKSFWTKENVLGKLFSYCFFSAVQPSHRNRCDSYIKNLFRPGLWLQGLCARLLNVKSGFLLYCIVLEASKINLTALTLWSCSWFFLHFKSLLFWLQFAFVITAEKWHMVFLLLHEIIFRRSAGFPKRSLHSTLQRDRRWKRTPNHSTFHD